MSEDVVPPFVSTLTSLHDCAEVIYTGNEDDRTLGMLSRLVQTSKSLRDNRILCTVLEGLKQLHMIKTRARAVLEEHLETPLLDNSVLDEFLASEPGAEMSRFHLLHAIRTICEGIRCNQAVAVDFKKIETNVYVEGILRKEDCVLLLGDMDKYKFSAMNSMYLFECVAYAKSNHKYDEFQNRHAVSRVAELALHKIARQRLADICFHLTGTGVYATMLTVCVRNASERRLINEFMDTAVAVPTHPDNDVLVSVFEIPGNLIKLQTLVYNVGQQPCSPAAFITTYVKYCSLTRKIFECVECDKLSFSDSEQFEASMWMIRNLEAMTPLRDDGYWKYRVQDAICTHMNLDTIEKLYQKGYIQRLADTGAQQEDIFLDLVGRWNMRPSNPNPWTLDASALPYTRFLGLSP